MKKKNLTSLQLKKTSVSKLNGGLQAPDRPDPIPLTRNITDCLFTADLRQCTWHSELFTACYCNTEWIQTCTIE